MWKLKSRFIFWLIVFIAGMVVLQMGLYLFHLWFNWEIDVNLFQYCVNVIQESTGEHTSVGFILNLLIGFTGFLALRRITRQVVLSRRLQRKLAGLQHDTLSMELNRLYRRAKQDILVIQNEASMAFTVGFLKRRIILTTGLLEMLDEREVEAVVWHETCHQSQFDPLKVFLITLISEALWFIPALKGWVYDYKTLKELLADQYAIRRMGSPVELGGALLKLAKRGWPSQPALGISFADTSINCRIKQLLNPNVPVRVPITLRFKPMIASVVLPLILMTMILGGCA